MVRVSCPLCGSYKNYQILYKANFKGLSKNLFSARRLPDGVHYQIVRCKKDGLVRSNPVLPDSKLVKLYQKSNFTYQTELKNLTNTYINSLYQVLPRIKKTDKILEIGCGNGFLMDKLASLGYKNIYGVEPSIEAVIKASSKIRRKIKKQNFKEGLYPKNSFKLIYLFQTLDHISNPNVFLKECLKIIQPGGFILAFNHNIDSFSAKLLGKKSPIIDIEHTFFYSPKTQSLIFNKNLFVIKKVYCPVNIISLRHLIWLFPIPKNIKKFLITSNIFNNINIPVRLGNLCIIAQKES